MGLGDEEQRGAVPFLSHRLRVPRLTRFVAVDVDLGPLAEVVCVHFVHLSYLSCISYRNFLKKLLLCVSHS